MKKNAKGIGLAIIGAGRVGLFRGEVAARHPAVEWIGIAELNHNRGGDVAARIGADFVTTSHRELLARPEVNAVLISTDEHLHVEPILAAVERGLPMLIEKPLATDLAQSARVLKAITDAKLDAVVGYTQRFRRKWLAGKEKVRSGALGDVTMVTSRAFMNRLVAIDNYKRTDDPTTISPMVISGTHALDIVMWYLEGKQPVECYARSIDKVLGPLYQGIDATAGMIMCADGTLYHLNISWALPVTGRGLQFGSRHQRHPRRAHHRRHPSRHGARGLKTAGRRLCARPKPPGRFPRLLSAGRHGARRIARPDARGDRFLAQPRFARPADPGRHGCGSP
jgi:predicted dehydrogenase